MMIVERSEYKGKPMLVIKRSDDDKFPFSFGVVKAKMILENLEEIKRFVEDNEKPMA
ncbi:hypothetical protein HZB08_01305 [Candidatus Saganbacteria bacterium]|uniref:Uncharacterized protein n=1 Tax=Candidatus Saganbacteria bacterium TaxID=2575572 RepID=A0A9D6UN26_UNCSA|nr:hypothetical protein [Candidatus Saganbacteria bacterium]